MKLDFMMTLKFTLGLSALSLALMLYYAKNWEPLGAGIFGIFAGMFWGFAMLIADRRDHKRAHGEKP